MTPEPDPLRAVAALLVLLCSIQEDSQVALLHTGRAWSHQRTTIEAGPGNPDDDEDPDTIGLCVHSGHVTIMRTWPRWTPRPATCGICGTWDDDPRLVLGIHNRIAIRCQEHA